MSSGRSDGRRTGVWGIRRWPELEMDSSRSSVGGRGVVG